MWTWVQATFEPKRNWFFRLRLLTLPYEDIEKLVDRMENEVLEIQANNLTFAWYMRGGATYDDVMNMSPKELKAMNKLIERNLETTKKSQLPFF